MNRVTEEQFLKRISKVPTSYKDNLQNIVFRGISNKIDIECLKHGIYSIRPYDYLNGHRCPECSKVKKLTSESFTKKGNLIFNNFYNYSLVEYKNNKTKVCIICPIHGKFWQRPNDHLNGCGCPKCAERGEGLNGTLTTQEFIDKANIIHDFKYIYSKTTYINSHTKVCITCSKHGDFWQIAGNHLQGSICPKCAKIVNFSKMAQEIYQELIDKNIEVEKEKTFEWLKDKGLLKLDFYLPKYNIGIEVQGEQHYKAFDRFGGKQGLEDTQRRDKIKKELCEEHGIKIIYVNKHGLTLNQLFDYVNDCKEKTDLSQKENIQKTKTS